MKRTEWRHHENLIKKNILAGVALIFIISLLLAGATFAWFTDESGSFQNIFTAGTVELSQPSGVASSITPILNETKTREDDLVDQVNISPTEYVYGEDGLVVDKSAGISPLDEVYDEGDEEALSLKTVDPTCKKVTWTFNNTGSKDAYVRVRPYSSNTNYIYVLVHMEVGKETAFIGVNEAYLPLNKNNFGQYIYYPLGVYTNENKLKLGIWQGASFNNYGYAYLWDDGINLHLELATNGGKNIDKVHYYAGLEEPYFIGFGNIGWEIPSKEYHYTPADSFYFSTSAIYSTFPPLNKAVPDIVLSSLYGNLINTDIIICPEHQGYWLEKDGWWYYGDVNRPTNVIKKVGEVKVCFKYCYLQTSEELTLHLEAQAVQSSHEAYRDVWKGQHPWQ